MMWAIGLLIGLGLGVEVRANAPDAVPQAWEVATDSVRTDSLRANAPPYVLTRFPMPATVEVQVDGTKRPFTLEGRTIVFSEALPDTAQWVVATYEPLPFEFAEVYFRRRIAEENPDSLRLSGVILEEPEPVATRPDLFGDTKLERSGSITRGVIAGNNRDVSLESGLRIQLAGEVTDGVNVRAVLTDENTPIQPDGTTQRLSEFDRVFIQLEADAGTATLGDYDLRFADSEFGVFARKLQGASITAKLPAAGFFSGGAVTAAGATSRGIFQSQDLQILDGVQGPYRLQGREGEQFIIVIAGSERVFVDGILLTRGETNDYIVDYSTGELTFTSRRLMTTETRVTVEFEYTVNRFTRTLLGSEASISFFEREAGQPGRLRFGARVLREADSGGFTDELSLTSADSLALTLAGDGFATRPGETLVPYDPEARFVQYVQQDTLFAGQTFRIFVPVSDTARVDSVFQVRFSRVGEGQGSYRRTGQSLNGIVFAWVGPGGGDSEPVRLLPKPKLQRLVDLNGAFEVLPGLEVFGEWAESGNDLNRLSPLDAGDDIGRAWLAGIRLTPTEIDIGGRDIGTLSAQVRRRTAETEFEAFGRTRAVEFNRKWNLSQQLSTTGGAGEESTEAEIRLGFTPRSYVQADWGRLDLEASGFEGRRAGVNAFVNEEGFLNGNYRLDVIDSNDQLLGIDGSWFRQNASLRKPLGNGRFTPLVEFEQEDRRQRRTENGQLAPLSEAFYEIRPGLAYETERYKATGTIEYRQDRGVSDGFFRDRSTAWTGQVRFEIRASRNLTTDADIGYRSRRFTDTFQLAGDQDSESIAVRWTGRGNGFERAVQASWLYEALTERTPILQETYILAGAEFGEYVWLDDNGDGIRQVDEFQPETTPFEGTYIQTFVPSDDLEPVINVKARLRMTLEPSRVWRDAAEQWKRWLARVGSVTTIDIQEKSRESELRQIYLLNPGALRDPATTINGRLRIRQQLELFKGIPKYGLNINLDALETLSQLSASTEARTQRTVQVKGRYRPVNTVSVALSGGVQQNQATSSQFTNRNFDIGTVSIEPALTLSLPQLAQIEASVAYSRKADDRPDAAAQAATVLKTPLSLRLTRVGRLQFLVRGERADVRVDGDATGLAAFELTDGRGAGVSYLWSVAAQYGISSQIRSSLLYDGRAPADAPTIHTVRVQFSLAF